MTLLVLTRASNNRKALKRMKTDKENTSVDSGESFSREFDRQLFKCSKTPLKAVEILTMQINVGYLCNQSCEHCHLNGGPDRTEVMSQEIMEKCLEIVQLERVPTVELTGGAPEMNPNFRWFVRELTGTGARVIVRSNLTAMLEDGMQGTPEFLKECGVEVIASLPCYSPDNVDSQRGHDVFRRSVKVLRFLNSIGYGIDGSDLKLNLIYNPGGASLPGDQGELEEVYKRKLSSDYGIFFNNLFTITNMPIGRFEAQLKERGKYISYMNLLIESFNSEAVEKVMCLKQISVGWDGSLYDCDFNQALGLKCSHNGPQSVFEFSRDSLEAREIVTGKHCLGCTAGAGSSCSGALDAI